jgi:hypothetical protein
MAVQTSKAMERGRIVHLDLAKYVNTPLDVPAVMPECVVLPFQRTLVNDVRSHPDKMVEQQWGFTHRWQETGWFTRSPDYKATWFRAILDVAMLYEDLVVEPIDWKTGKVYGENAEQMELFALSAMCKFKAATHVITRLVYVDAHAEQIAEYPASDKELLQRKWEGKVRPMFTDTTYLPKPGKRCYYCDGAKSKGGPCKFG